MCGIFGEFLYKGKFDIGNSLERLNLLKHRGPDGYGFEFGNFITGEYAKHHNNTDIERNSTLLTHANYFFGHRRLSIIDLNDNAFQPMESADKSCSIIFNGEIYNYIELKDGLIQDGYIFNTDHSDTEVILNAYLKWGTGCLEKFRGMFAFAILDRRNGTVFIARDRIGVKPLYYEKSGNIFSFSSELPPLVRHKNIKRKIDITALNCYMIFGYIPCPYSIFEGINKLAPASYALYSVKDRTFSIKKYWDIDVTENNTNSADQFIKQTEEMLTEAVKLRLRADVPIGAFISGGIDSTLVVKKIKEIGKKQFDIYGADFPNTKSSEKIYIEEVACKYEQHLNLSSIDLKNISNIDEVIKIFDEPFDGGSSIALFDLFKKATKSHKVILTGDGGDEMFVGYPRYLEFPPFNAFYNLIRKLYFPAKLISFFDAVGVKSSRLNKFRDFIDGDLISNYMRKLHDFNICDVLKKEYKIGSIDQIDIFMDIRNAINEHGFSTTKSLQYFELKTILPDRMLYKLDRFSMFYGVEARSPFLDHKLVEFAFTIPERFNTENSNTKNILKKILLTDFSHEFVYRKKQGFGNPLSFWFRNISPEKIFGVLQNPNSTIFSYLDYNRTHNYFPQIVNGYYCKREKDLWRLLVLGLYLENFRDVIEK